MFKEMKCKKHRTHVTEKTIEKQTGYRIKITLCPVCFKDDFKKYLDLKKADGEPLYKIINGN